MARTGSLGWALVVAAVWVAPAATSDASAASTLGPRLEVTGALELRVGAHSALSVVLTLPEGAAEPVLLTPTAEGEALEVVRGRLMRGDARRAQQGALYFELPVVAKSSGSSIVRIHALAYACREDLCRAVEAETQVHMVVLPN